MISAEALGGGAVLADAPPMAQHQLLLFLLQVGVLVLTATLLGRLANRLQMPAIAGELLAGFLLGPSLLGHLSPTLANWLLPLQAEPRHMLDAAAQLGVLLFVAVTGMQIDVSLLRRNRLNVARISAAALLFPLGAGLGTAYLLPHTLLATGTDRLLFALFLGIALSVSAIPVIAKTLTDMNLMHRDIAQLILATAIVDDTVGWLLLSVVSAMAIAQLSAATVAVATAWIVVTGVVTMVGRALFRAAAQPSHRVVSGIGSDVRPAGASPILAVAVAAIFLAAAATTSLGLEPVLGAFAAGIVLGAASPVQRTALASLRPVVNGVLAPLYFANAGLHADLTALVRPATLVAFAVVLGVAVVSKFLGAFVGAKAGHLSNAEALAIGGGLNSRGVIQIIIATTGLRLGVLNTDSYTIIILTAVVTSLMAPPILRVAVRRIVPNRDEDRREQDVVTFHVDVKCLDEPDNALLQRAHEQTAVDMIAEFKRGRGSPAESHRRSLGITLQKTRSRRSL